MEEAKAVPKLVKEIEGGVTFGADPEIFGSNPEGQIVGSELIIPQELQAGNGTVVRDGVQLEIHVRPAASRQVFIKNLAGTMVDLQKYIRKVEGIDISFKSVVKMQKAQMLRLSEESRLLGCQPSLNAYDEKASIKVNPKTYMMRSAGGHVHFGVNEKLKEAAHFIVKSADVLLGNQSVLMDREPLQAIRRRVYGRAGEYRIQPHGLEYRTLDNFWLKSPELASFVLAMARMSVKVIDTSFREWNAWEALQDCVKQDDIRKAINKNDVDLAYKNLDGVEKFISTFCADDEKGLNMGNFKAYRNFLAGIDKNGLEHYFPKSPFEYWGGRVDKSWEEFLQA